MGKGAIAPPPSEVGKQRGSRYELLSGLVEWEQSVGGVCLLAVSAIF